MKKMVFNVLFLSVLGFAACGSGENTDSVDTANEQNEQDLDSKKKEQDAAFVVKAAAGGMMEVELGKLALTNGESSQVKDFGKMMVDQHGAANMELEQLAAGKGISLPATPDNDQQQKIDELAAKKGGDFDRAYIALMVEDHKEDIDLFQNAAEDANDPDIKIWASGKITVLRDHLVQAQHIQEQMESKTQ